MNNSDDLNLPRVRVIKEVGETAFQFLGLVETILQGWSPQKRKQVYLFKPDSGVWSYYDKNSSQIIPISQWSGKAAWVGDEWIKMTKYHKVKLHFLQPITFTSWVDGKKQPQQGQEVIVTITDTAYKSFVEAAAGRSENSAYQFVFKTTKKKGGGSMTYVEKIIWKEELPNLAV